MEITNGVKSAVNAYLMARTLAECERERVDKIANEILNTAKYYADSKFITRGRTSGRITENKDAWMLREDEHRDFLIDLKTALIKAGYKIKSKLNEPEYSYNCPALSAEHLLTQTGWLVVDTTAEMIGESNDFRDRLLCIGLKKYNEFIDLAVKMVVNTPGFKNPLTGAKV